MNLGNDQQFLQLYQTYRFEDQFGWYKDHRHEFARAQAETIWISVSFMILTFIAGVLEVVDIHWFKVTCMIIAAICPVLSTAFAAYSTLYGFEQQTKLYQDTVNNLMQARALMPDPQQIIDEADFTRQLSRYIQEVENTLQAEQGQWGQLVKRMKPPEA